VPIAASTDAPPATSSPLAPPSDLASPPSDAPGSSPGLRQRVLRPGRGGAPPAAHDRVSVHYTSWNADGSVYASTLPRGAPAVLRVEDTSPGFQQALTQMTPGERRRLWLSASLARTQSGGPAGALVTDLELVQVAAGLPQPPPPPDLAAAPAAAERTASGLISRQLSPQKSDERAERHDRVRIVYVGWDESGRVFDSSAPRGAFAEVTLTHGFPGWQEALAMLRRGEKRRFWIPSALAYDAYPGMVRGQLVYDIELVAIVDMPAPPPVPRDVARAPRGAAWLPSGVAYRVLAPGSGTIEAGPGSIVDVHYTYWTPSGRMVDSTLPNGRPHRAHLKDGDLPPGVTEVVIQMVAGERRRIWVPEPLSYPATHAAKGPLVFDLELLVVYHGKKRVDSVEPEPR
jgi:peptidylprolyl isomerase